MPEMIRPAEAPAIRACVMKSSSINVSTSPADHARA